MTIDITSSQQLHISDIDSRIDDLLGNLMRGQSRVSSTAYDTAWVARIAEHYPERNYHKSLAWIRNNQHEDGSWGSDIFHNHDRIVSTLAAIIALAEVGDGLDDKNRIQAGETFLWRNNTRLHHDANDTIGFPVIMVALVQQAKHFGLDIPRNLYRDVEKIEKKLNMLDFDPAKWQKTTLHHSLDALMQYLPDASLDFADEIGCVGCSPSATAATLMKETTTTERSKDYLEQIIEHQGDGGAPNVDRIDVFEAAWSLKNLLKDDLISPDDPAVRRILDALWDIWSDDVGVSFSSSFQVPDLDDTAVTFSVLRWGGYPASADVFEIYEADDHFNCFPGEIDPSLSAHIRMLGALQYAKDAPQYERWHEMISKFLRISDLNGYFWFDKWHASPYYLTSPTIWLLHGVVDDLLPQRIKWIMKTQRVDGGWGFYNQSTVEETAYCLQALFYADNHIQKINPAIIDAGIHYFLEKLPYTTYPPMWIGKGLYTPYFVIESSIIATLQGIRQYTE